MLATLATMTAFANAAYSPTVGERAVRYSKASYCASSDLDHWQCGPICITVTGVASATRVSDYALGVFAFVAYNSKNNEIVASFRGSQNIANWILNIDIHQTTYKKLSTTIKVHQGFYNSYLAVKS